MAGAIRHYKRGSITHDFKVFNTTLVVYCQLSTLFRSIFTFQSWLLVPATLVLTAALALPHALALRLSAPTANAAALAASKAIVPY